MFVIGIDEAGYGPLLGPLVVTSVILDCEEYYSPKKIWNAIGTDWGIADSKLVLSHRKMAPGEQTVMALLEALGLRPKTRHELFEAICVEPPSFDHRLDADARQSCAAIGVQRLNVCESDERRLPRWAEAPAPERARDLLQRLDTVGVKLHSARAIALCPGIFNRQVEQGVSKAIINWQLFEKLLRLAQPLLAAEGFAACGKLGGRNRYGSLLVDLGLSSPIVEGRPRSAYDVEGLGRVEFVRGAETVHPPVAMASMIGKLIREHTLDQWHRMFEDRIPGLRTCSGYRDRVTEEYVSRTARVRKKLGIPDICFLRLK